MTWRGLFRRITWTSTVLCLLGGGISVWYGAGVVVNGPWCAVRASIYHGGVAMSVAVPRGGGLPGHDVVTEVVRIRHERGLPLGSWWAAVFDDGIALHEVFSDGEQPDFHTDGTHYALGLPVWAAWLLFTGAAFAACRGMEGRRGRDMGPSGSSGFPA